MRPSVFKTLDEYNQKQVDFAAWCKRRQIATDRWITLSNRNGAGDKVGGARVLLDDDGAIVYGLGGGHAGKKLGEALTAIKRDAAAQRGQGTLFSDFKSQARKERKQAQTEKKERQKEQREERKKQREERGKTEQEQQAEETLKRDLRAVAYRYGNRKNRDSDVEKALQQAAAYAQENKDAEYLTGVKVAMEGGMMENVIGNRESIKIASESLARLRNARDTKELDSLRDSALDSIKRREEYAIRRLTDAQMTLYIKQGDKLTPKQGRMFKAAFMQVRHNFHRAQNRILDESRSVRSDLNNEFVPF